MTRFVWHDGAWVEPGRAARPRKGVAIHRDFAEPIMSHADGRMHSSRSTYDASLRAVGAVEVGKTEMRKLQAGPAVRATKLESPRAMITRLMNE